MSVLAMEHEIWPTAGPSPTCAAAWEGTPPIFRLSARWARAIGSAVPTRRWTPDAPPDYAYHRLLAAVAASGPPARAWPGLLARPTRAAGGPGFARRRVPPTPLLGPGSRFLAWSARRGNDHPGGLAHRRYARGRLCQRTGATQGAGTAGLGRLPGRVEVHRSDPREPDGTRRRTLVPDRA